MSYYDLIPHFHLPSMKAVISGYEMPVPDQPAQPARIISGMGSPDQPAQRVYPGGRPAPGGMAGGPDQPAQRVRANGGRLL